MLSSETFRVAIESCIDISAHIISERGLEAPEKVTDIPSILAKERIITEDFVETFTKMIALRNIIIHEYLYIEMEKIYEVLQRTEDFRRFAICIRSRRWLEVYSAESVVEAMGESLYLSVSSALGLWR
jgi:uncharacterized protein YutE (UPF0331/DUF86 family)